MLGAEYIGKGQILARAGENEPDENGGALVLRLCKDVSAVRQHWPVLLLTLSFSEGKFCSPGKIRSLSSGRLDGGKGF